MGNFNKQKYDIEYIKSNRKVFKVDLKIEEMEELENLIVKLNIKSKAEFLRMSINLLRIEKSKND